MVYISHEYSTGCCPHIPLGNGQWTTGHGIPCEVKRDGKVIKPNSIAERVENVVGQTNQITRVEGKGVFSMCCHGEFEMHSKVAMLGKNLHRQLARQAELPADQRTKDVGTRTKAATQVLLVSRPQNLLSRSIVLDTRSKSRDCFSNSTGQRTMGSILEISSGLASGCAVTIS